MAAHLKSGVTGYHGPSVTLIHEIQFRNKIIAVQRFTLLGYYPAWIDSKIQIFGRLQ